MSAVACHVTRQAALLALPQRLVNDHQPPAQRVVAEKAVVAMVEEEREVEEERAHTPHRFVHHLVGSRFLLVAV